MIVLISVLIFVAGAGLTFWRAAGSAKAQHEFNAKWAAHDIHFDDVRLQWRHDGLCPCGSGPFPIRHDTAVPSGICHCGTPMNEHSAWDNHNPVDMAE